MSPLVMQMLAREVARQRIKQQTRSLLRPGVQPPGGGTPKSTPGLAQGAEVNSGQNRWYIPNYNDRVPAPGALGQDVMDQRSKSVQLGRLTKTLLWRANQPKPIAGRYGPERRPQDSTYGMPQFNDIGVDDERQWAFEKFVRGY